jgi:hypothetical protein
VVAAALALTIPAVPWLVLADSLADGGASIFAIVGLSLLGGGLMAAFGPVVAKPVAGLERGGFVWSTLVRPRSVRCLRLRQDRSCGCGTGTPTRQRGENSGTCACCWWRRRC